MNPPPRPSPGIMGILNLTPDSFSDGGQFIDVQHAVDHGVKMAADGALFIDLGAESTRPGSKSVPAKTQLKRILPVLKKLRKKIPITLSIDTQSAEVAEACLIEGARCINDISALRHDPNMVPLLEKWDCHVILMHMRGTPETMQKNPVFGNVVNEILAFFNERIAFCKNNGIPRQRILLDPGFGFGKTYEHNLEIMRNFNLFQALSTITVAGVSRKGFLGRLSGVNEPAQRDSMSIAAGLYLADNGADLLRVHDVAGHVEALKIRELKNTLRARLAVREKREENEA